MKTAFHRGWILAILALASCLSSLEADDWGRFRGPNGSGISTTASLPPSFDSKDALLWSTEIPFGRSSPVVGADLVFLTGIDGEALTTLAVSRKSGEIQWRRTVERKRKADLHQATDSSTPTPVTDGTNVFVFFQEFGMLSYDAAGRERWRLPLDAFRNFYGMAASPILVGDNLILLCDQGGGSFLLAVDRDSGKEAWRRSRAKRRESYTTPIVYPTSSDARLLLVFGSKYLDAYDPRTGEPVWTLPGLGAGPVASPVIDGNRIYVVALNHNEEPMEEYSSLLEKHDSNDDGMLASQELEGTWMINNFGWIDFDGDGSLTARDWSELGKELDTESWGVEAIEIGEIDQAPKVVWNYRKNLAYIPSLLAYEGIVYMVKDSIVTSLDAKTGEMLKRDRLEQGKTYASPIAASGEILFSQLDGKVSVVSSGPQWEVRRGHDFGEEIHSTPALVDGVLYLRTRGKLLAFKAPVRSEQAGSDG